MISIYGPPGSSAGRCYWTLEEAGVPWEAAPFEFRRRDNRSPEFLAMNPNGKVPVLRDGDTVLWESVAIDMYLADKYKPGLMGSTLEDRARIYQWSIWSQVEYQAPMIQAFIQKVFVPEERRDQGVIDRNLEKVAPLNELLNEHLRERSYMVGPDFTLADLHVASVAKINAQVGTDLGTLGHLQRWLDRMLERPAARKVAELEAGPG